MILEFHIQARSTHLTNHIYNWILNNLVDHAFTKNPAKRGTDERCESDQIQESAHLKSPPQPKGTHREHPSGSIQFRWRFFYFF